MGWFWLVACITVVVEPAEWPEDTSSPPIDTPDDTDPDTLPTEPTVPSETGEPPADACAESELVVVESLVADRGRMVNQYELLVTTSVSVPVAARCIAAADTTEAHLLEDLGGTEHVFQFSALLPDTEYICTAAPICPRSGAALPSVALSVGGSPQGLAPVSVWVDPILGMTGDYTLFNTKPGGACAYDGGFLQLVDPDGRPRFWHALPPVNVGVEARYHGDDTFVFGGGISAEARPRILDIWEGETYASEALLDYASTSFHHDGKMIDDGRIVTLELQDTVYNGSVFEGFAVRAHDPVTGVVSWEYTSQTAVDTGELTAGGAYGDVWHANFVDVKVENGVDKIYLSLCYYGWVLKIDPVAGHIEWILGAGGDFSLVDAGGLELDPFEFSQCQHGLEIDGDRVLFYDNGWNRGYSRASEYELDTSAMVARLLWTFADDGWYEGTLGDVDYLDNGRVLINRAHPACWSYGAPSQIVEFDPLTGLPASRVTFLDANDSTYRAEQLDGCELFANAKYCEILADRLDELAPAFKE